VPRAIIILVVFTGCAASTERTTWEQDAREGITTSAPRGATRRSAVTTSLNSATRPIALDEIAAQDGRQLTVDSTALELSLIRFTTKRRKLAQEIEPVARPNKERAPWPRPLESAFEKAIDELERGFDVPKGSLPRRVLIQARVTLEVELENSEARYGPATAELVQRMGKLFGTIALHMRASAPLDDERHARLADRELALGWPVSPVIVTSPFGYRRDPILGRENVRFHAGVDLGGESGDVVHASAPGRVSSAGWTGGHGRTVVVQHAGGYQTMYAHLRTIVVSIGVEVEAGAPLGLMGSSGRSTGPHLHFEVRRGGVPLDPLDVLGPTFAQSPAKSRESAAARD
jgi:murein DD-endopeptidase MepM/ murein hydrolase activator NlpD